MDFVPVIAVDIDETLDESQKITLLEKIGATPGVLSAEFAKAGDPDPGAVYVTYVMSGGSNPPEEIKTLPGVAGIHRPRFDGPCLG